MVQEFARVIVAGFVKGGLVAEQFDQRRCPDAAGSGLKAKANTDAIQARCRITSPGNARTVRYSKKNKQTDIGYRLQERRSSPDGGWRLPDHQTTSGMT